MPIAQSTRDRVVGWVTTNPLPAISLCGIALYGVLRLAYVFFYLRLRTTPEEVGDGYSQILAQSIVGALELILYVMFIFVVLGEAVAAVLLLVEHKSGARRRVAHLAVLRRSLLLAVVAVFVSLPALAWWQGGLALGGQTVRNVYFIGIPYLPVLAVQAVPAEVQWVATVSPDQLHVADRFCLMYLGQANGVTVFYDVQTHESLRFPSSAIAVSLSYVFSVPTDCLSE